MAQKTVTLPELHIGQKRVWDNQARLNVVRCGRRWGKTINLDYIAELYGANGMSAGIFTAEYKQQAEPWDHLREILDPVITTANKNDGTIKVLGGGKIDFWTLNDNVLAGRGREYDVVLIDEAAFTKPNQMIDIWKKSIKPTMLTTKGRAWVFSTPSGVDPENFFYAICHDAAYDFKQFHEPAGNNPYVPQDELAREREKNDPLVFKQEYMAEFVDWSGIMFFAVDKMLVDGAPVPYPEKCDGVYAVIDTAVKAGKENDGTAVTYFGINKYYGLPLIILDWDIIKIEGNLLEAWMPNVLRRLDELTATLQARHGNLGAFIEDANAGAILLQQGRSRGWKTIAIDSKLVQAGKDERAISVSGYYHQQLIKISRHAYEKEVIYEGIKRNHLLAQVSAFRIGDKDAFKRADDLLDTFIYGIAIGVGDKYGY